MEDELSSVDRISDLPNEVLVHILSFMSTKEATPTFMLSKRWNNIWASLPYLKFDYAEFGSEDLPTEIWDAKFIGFVDGVLRQRGTAPIEKFRLICGIDEISPHPAMIWIDHIVVNCKPRVLSVDISLEKNFTFEIPSSVLSCSSLEEMELRFCSECSDVFLPEQVFLPSLKKLILCGVMLDDGFLEKLFSGSCFLEKLVLGSCMVITDLRISSNQLKHFALGYCEQCVDVQVDAPSLINLYICSSENGRVFLKNLSSLVDSKVQIYGPHMYYRSEFPGYVKHISALANATTLDLTLASNVMKENLENELFNFPTFIHLKTLLIGNWCMVNDFDLVAAFLKHSPNLQMLKLFHIRGDIECGALFLKEYLQTVVIDTEPVNSVFDLDIPRGTWLYNEAVLLIPPKHRGMAEKLKAESFDLLVKQLRACVRTIGEIRIMKPRGCLFDLDDD